MAFVCARLDLANRALDAGKPLPVESGFMGIVTLEDIMESLLQERIYDEWDARDREKAVATLQKWAATTLQGFMRKKAAQKRIEKEQSNDEKASLLNAAKGQNGQYNSLG